MLFPPSSIFRRRGVEVTKIAEPMGREVAIGDLRSQISEALHH